MNKIFKKYFAILILAAGIVSALAFGSDFKSIGLWTVKSLYEKHTVELVFIIYLVLLLGEILEVKQSLSRMVKGLTGLLRKKSLIIAFAPAFIGLLPMPGGALVSAPILDKTLGRTKISPELKTFTNYWFRHIWEYSWPLYPGLILTAAIFSVPVVEIIKIQFYFTLIAAALGALSIKLNFAKFREAPAVQGSFPKNVKAFLAGSWEILVVVIMIVAFKIYMLAAIGLAVMVSLFLLKAGGKRKLSLIKKAFNLPILAVLVSVMIFKNLIIHSDMSSTIESLIEHAESYRAIIMFFIPFSIGFLTGVNQSYAGIAFPIFIPIVGLENPDLNMVAFLYISGFMGVLLSPVHLCLVLSSEYYGANLAKVFKFLIPPVLVMILLMVMIYGLKI